VSGLYSVRRDVVWHEIILLKFSVIFLISSARMQGYNHIQTFELYRT
jgi:hypothetical protein